MLAAAERIPMPIPDYIPTLFRETLPAGLKQAQALPAKVAGKARSQFSAAALRVTLPFQRRKDIELFERTAYLGNFEEMKRIAATYADAVTWRDKAGKTLLHHAAVYNNAAMAAYYLDRGADIAAKDNNGNRALHDAAQCAPHDPGEDASATLKLLLARGAKREVRNKLGQTPLLYAVERNKPWNVRTLVLAGAHTLACDLKGETPQWLAEKFPGGEMLRTINTAYEDWRQSGIAATKARHDAEVRTRIKAAENAVLKGTTRAIKPLRHVTFKRGR